MKIKPPPKISESIYRFNDAFGDLVRITRKYVTDDQGRYLPWDKLSRRIEKGDDPALVWKSVKFSRNLISKKLILKAKSEQPFCFTITELMQQRLYNIDRAFPLKLASSFAASSNSDSQRYLVESLMAEEAISSSQLEGASTTRKVAKQMLETGRKPRDKSEQMIINNFRLMKEAWRIKDQPLSLQLILDLHAIAVDKTEDSHVTPGEFRTTDDVVVCDDYGEIVHQPPSASELLTRVERLCDFANEPHDGKDSSLFIHPCAKAIMLHFMLAYEHPFSDGNGRTARALFYWFMLKQGYWQFEYVSISSILCKAPIKYAKSFLYVEADDFDLTYFIDYQLEVMERAANAFLAFIQRRREEDFQAMLWLDTIKGMANLNHRQVNILRKSIISPGRIFTIKEICSDFFVKENTARSDLKELVDLKLLAEGKDGKTKLYIARGDIEQRTKANKNVLSR